jgi:hypothetical protein
LVLYSADEGDARSLVVAGNVGIERDDDADGSVGIGLPMRSQVLGQVPPRTTPRSMPRPHICAACDPPAFRPSPTAGLMSTFGASVYHRLRKAQPCSLREMGRQNVEEIGAGEGIRTLDPDLGKVVLYP